MSIRIILADDHQIMRDGLRLLLDQDPDMKVIAETDNGRTVVQQAVTLKPDVIIMDVTMPELNGIEATREVMAAQPNVKVIALTMHTERNFVAGMIAAGAAGFLLKNCASEELLNAVHQVMTEGQYLSPGISSIILSDYRDKLAKEVYSASSTVLTPREREVLQLLAEGKHRKDVAALLHLSVKTVETHCERMMSKLKLHNLADLTKYAIREGLTSI